MIATKRFRAFVALTALLILAVGGGAGAGPAAAPQPVSGGSLSIAYVTTAPHIDLHQVNQGAVNEVAHYFYETLYDRDPNGKVIPLLVKEEQITPDGLTWTLKLQPNVKFHDGTPLNAAAVKWNFDRKINRRFTLFDILPFRTIEAVDELTLRLTLTRPAPNLRPNISTKTFAIYSPTWAQRVGDEGMRLNAVGTGPFTVAEFRPNEILRLRKNPNYWQKGLPYLDEVVFRVVNDNNTRATMIQARDVDVAQSLSVQDIRRLKTTPGFKILEGIGSQQAYITLNNAKPPLDDVKVRRAINHAVDKEAIIRNVYLGGGKVAQAVYANPTIDGYVPAGSWKFDQNAARALLDEAGWRMGPGGVRVKDGRPMQLELITRRGGSPGDYETSEIVQGMLKQVGIDVRLVVLESATFVPRVTLPRDRANYDMVYLTVGTFTGDIEYILQTFYHSSSAAPRYFNRAHYGNPVVDQLIEQSLKATTAKSRNSIYMGQIMRTVFNDAPILQLIDMPQELAVRDNVHSIFLEPAGNNWPAKYAWKTR